MLNKLPITTLVQVGNSPLKEVKLEIGRVLQSVYLKMEGENPTGSSKVRTALYLIKELEDKGMLSDDSEIIESTSGNLGVALAFLCSLKGIEFTAVIDPKTTEENVARIRQFGAKTLLADVPDENGGFLLSRLALVRSKVTSSYRYVWPNQYQNYANPMAHYSSTAPEIYGQMRHEVDAIFIPVSTGGTLAGISRYFRENSPRTKICAVDAFGSIALEGPSLPRRLTGIGAAQKSYFVDSSCYDKAYLVRDEEAFRWCRRLSEYWGIKLGGSGGAAIAACSNYLADAPKTSRVVCVCPDRGDWYESTIYNDHWLLSNGTGANKVIQV